MIQQNSCKYIPLLQVLASLVPSGSTLLADAMDAEFMAWVKHQTLQRLSGKLELARPIIEAMASTLEWNCAAELAATGWQLDAVTDAKGWARVYGRTAAGDVGLTVAAPPANSKPYPPKHMFILRATAGSCT